MIDKLKNWFIEAASVMFDDRKGDFRALPKTVSSRFLYPLISRNYFFVIYLI